MIALTERTETVIMQTFNDPDDQKFVKEMLINECGANVPLCKNWTPDQMDRIRFGVLKLSEGDINKLGKAIDLAKVDWRDLLMTAKFASDTDAHNKWFDAYFKSKHGIFGHLISKFKSN